MSIVYLGTNHAPEAVHFIKPDGFFGHAVVETWPTSHRHRFPIGLHRDPLRNWVVSDMTMACCKPLEVPQEWLEEWHEDMARRSGMRIATEFADYRLRREYAKVGRGEI